jgi:hypothetical protein
MLRKLDQNIWVAEQPFTFLGLSVGTRMTLIQLKTGQLVAISPIQITDVIKQQIEDIGVVHHIVAPNLYHYKFAATFKVNYPRATFWAAPGLIKKKPELPIDQTITSSNLFLDELDCIQFEGFQTLPWGEAGRLNESVFFHPTSRSLILTDTAYNFDPSFPVLTQFATKVLGGYNRLSPSWLERLATKDVASVRRAVQRVLQWDFQRVIMAHGTIVEVDAKQKFQEGYEWFLGASAKK